MKKVKTIISSLFIILASALMTACSCGDAGSGMPSDIIHVYEQAIDITCDHQGTEKNTETGYLTIRLHLNEEFKITYDLSPSNVTTTQVDWDFITNDDIVVSKNNSYSYAQGKSHTVTFVAKKVGNTVLQFKTKATEKITQATIIVGEAPQVLPKFVEITDYSYNPETGKVMWAPVTQQKLHTGQIVNAPTNNGQVSGLTGYELQITDLTNDVDLDPVIVDKCEYELPRGVTYAVKARALGDGYGDGYGFTVSDGSFPSESFKFHQLATATELKNNNGSISYLTPIHSYENRIYYNGSDASMSISRTNDSPNASKLDQFKYNEVFEKNPSGLNEYSISIASYPNPAIYNSQLGYALDIDSGVRYYPSLKTESILVKKLEAPTITMTDKLANATVGGVEFGKGTENKPYASSIINWSINTQYSKNDYDVKYAYAIYKGDTRVIPSESDFKITENTSFDTSELWKLGNDYAGNYRIEVYTLGKSSTTIESSKVSFYFNVLGKIDADNTSIADNRIYLSPAIANVAGADIYFINTTDKSKSQRKYVDGFNGVAYVKNTISLDITTLNLAPGEYDVYAKYTGIKGNGNSLSSTSTTGDINKVSNSPIVVASPVSYHEISSEGIIKFAKVNGVSEYIININKFSGGQNEEKISATLSMAEGEYSANNIYTSYTALGYTQDGQYNYVSIFDIFKNFFYSKAGVAEEHLENRVNGYLMDATFNYNIISVGAGQNGINSSASAPVQFKRVDSLGNISLNNNVLSFDSLGNVDYIVEFNGRTYYQSATSGKVSIDLTTARDVVYNEPLIKAVNKESATNTFYISVVGTPGISGSGDTGLLNSIKTEISFRVTDQATDVFALSNGDIVWSMPDADLNDFMIRFYDVNNELILERKIIPAKYEAPSEDPVIPDVGEDEGDGEEGSEEGTEPVEPVAQNEDETSNSINQFVYNISDIINEIYAQKGNITLGITLEEIIPNEFTGLSSEAYYIAKLADINMRRVNIGEDPAIEFDAISGLTNITYTLTITKDEDIANATTFDKVLTGALAQYRLSELGINAIGKYVISLMASRDNSLDINSANTPFVLSNKETTITAEIVSSIIRTSANGKNITWTSIHDSATYSVAYKAENAINYDSSEDVASATTYEVFSKLATGKYTFIVTPSIDYVTTGIILTKDDPEPNSVVKLPTVASASDFTTENGLLVFTIDNELIDGIEVSVKLLANGAEMPASDYSLVRDGRNFTIDIPGVAYNGAKDYTVAITSLGYIDSDVSTASYSATKINTATNFTKQGQWIMWDVIENATHYQLKFVQVGGVEPFVINLEYDESTGDIKYESVDADSNKIFVTDTNKVKIESGKVMYLFDETIFVDGMSGTYNYTLTAYTNKVGYLNGAESSPLQIFKLSNAVSIDPSFNNIALSGYVVENDNFRPQAIQYIIERYHVETIAGAEDEDPIENIVIDQTYTSAEIAFETIEASITNAETSYLINLDDIGFTVEGNYRITIKFIGSGDAQLSSEIVENAELVRLATSVPFTLDGVITWATVESATTYSVRITDKDNNITEITELSLTTVDQEIGVEETRSVAILTEANIAEKLPEFKFNINEEYKIQVMANGASLSSTWSAPFTVKKLKAPTNVQVIKAESGNIEDKDGNLHEISAGDPLLVWDDANSVVNRLNYGLNFCKDGVDATEDLIIYNTTSTGSELLGQLLPKDKPVGEYELKLRVIGNSTQGNAQIGLLTSNYSGQDILSAPDTNPDGEGSAPVAPATPNPIITYVADTANVGVRTIIIGEGESAVSTKAYSWDAVTGAYAYKLTFRKGTNITSGDADYITYVSTNNYVFKNSEFPGSGYYTITINAITNPSVSIISTYQPEGVENTLDNYDVIYRTPTVDQLFVLDGRITWALKLDEIENYLAPYVDNNESLLYTYFATSADGSTTETIDSSKLRERVLNYIVKKINGQKMDYADNADVNAIISHLMNFRINLNGVDGVVTPNSANVVRIATGATKSYVTITENYIDTDYLMFTYDLTNERIADEEGVEGYRQPGEYIINISPIGNMIESDEATGLITTTDGRYDTNKLLKAYKPMTPETWVDDESAGEDDAKQIANGELLWKLVTNDDSTTSVFKYHKDYKITATPRDNLEINKTVRINIDDTIVDDVNVNITNENQYRRSLLDLFASQATTNTNYNLTISVAGTADSSLITDKNTKIYLNSNTFAYKDHFNILENLQKQVTDSVFSWDYCVDSTATKVVIYGPFDYAPEPELNENDKYEFDGQEFDTYDLAQAAWKNAISADFELSLTNTDRELGPVREELLFVANTDVGDDGNIAERPHSFTLTDDAKYGAGSYIIRKQEIGNGRGVISTDFSDELMIGGVASEPYGVIATKLDVITATLTSGSQDRWVVDGKFVWEEVEQANAYHVVLEKLNSGEVVAQKDMGIVRDTYLEMPEDVIYGETSASYRLTVVAMRVDETNQIVPNYFNGDTLVTDAYGRAKTPDNVTINGDGTVTWDADSQGTTVAGYQIKVNANDEDLTTLLITDLSNSQKSFELGGISQNGTIIFRVRSKAVDDYLNSMYALPIVVTKLPNPNNKVVEGVFDWKTDSSEFTDQNPTGTVFEVVYDNETIISEAYGIDTINYPLFTDIESYDQRYVLSEEYANAYAPGEYKFYVQFKGANETGDASNATTDHPFIISSSVIELTATKLTAPVLENLDFNDTDALGSGNRLTWNMIENAGGYRVKIFALTGSATPEGEEVSPIDLAESMLEIDTLNADHAKYFEFDDVNNKVNLKISEIVNYFESSEEGIDLKIYVQAIGTVDSRSESAPYYISSSYSDVKAISIPSMPTSYDFDPSTGVVSWGIDERNTNNIYNAIVSMTYTVTDVTREDYINYWSQTSDVYFNIDNISQSLTSSNAYDNRFAEIISRKLTSIVPHTITIDDVDVEVYDITVLDTVFLQGRDATPTSYQLTNIGFNYEFEIVITAGDENYKGKYQSLPLRFSTNTNGTPINMNIFGGSENINGDGSILLPYIVTTATEFNRIGFFADRHFVITQDIDFGDVAFDSMFTSDFTGTITGRLFTDKNEVERYPVISGININIDTNNFYGSKLYYDAGLTDDGQYTNINIAIMNKLCSTATISNITLDVNYNILGISDRRLNYNIAGLAVINEGTIDTVHITGRIYVSNGITNATLLGGMVVTNNGTITNSSVTVSTGNNGIYAFDAGNSSTKVGGIATINNSIITSSHFTGDISSNYIGGITVENHGDIDKCYADGNAYVYDINPRVDNDTNYKGVHFGGIASVAYGNSSIENSYSLMKVTVTALGNGVRGYIGGLVGTINEESVATGQKIYITNNYTVARFVMSSANNKGTVTAYEFMTTHSSIEFNNNYFIAERSDNETNINNDGIKQTEIADKIVSTTKEGLKVALANLKDGENNNIYDVTGEYPKHA